VSQVFSLGVIAIAVLVMAMVQVVVLLQVARMAKQAAAATADLRKELTPLIAKVHKVADDAGKVSALALTQLERVDRVMDMTAQRVDDTLAVVQNAVVGPVRQGAAVLAGLKAAMAVFRSRQDRRRYGRDDEDALFIG
jgi:malonyl CoA-acyl carrier protein transacylase